MHITLCIFFPFHSTVLALRSDITLLCATLPVSQSSRHWAASAETPFFYASFPSLYWYIRQRASLGGIFDYAEDSSLPSVSTFSIPSSALVKKARQGPRCGTCRCGEEEGSHPRSVSLHFAYGSLRRAYSSRRLSAARPCSASCSGRNSIVAFRITRFFTMQKSPRADVTCTSQLPNSNIVPSFHPHDPEFPS